MADSGQSATKLQQFYEKAHNTGVFPHLRNEFAKNILADAKVKRILDIGCGTGDFGVMFKSVIPDLEVTGIDISEAAVSEAKSKGINAMRLDLSTEKLPFPDNYFDGIYCGEIIEHVFDTGHLMDEMRRVIKPSTSGRLCPIVLTTPNLGAWYNRILLLIGYQPLFTEVSTRAGFGHPVVWWMNAGHIRMFTCRALKEFVVYHKFQIERLIGLGVNTYLGFGARFKFFLIPLNFFLRPFPSLSSELMVVMKKTEAV